MPQYVTTQSIAPKRLALYDEYDRLWQHSDRESNARREQVWKQLVLAPTEFTTYSEYDADTDTVYVHIVWEA